MMNYEECQSIITQFRKLHAPIIMSKFVHGIQVVLVEGNYQLQLVVTQKVDASELRADELMPSSFQYTIEGITNTIQCSVVEEAIQQPCVLQGDQATFDPTNGYGTVGWNVYAQDQGLWLAISCYHVFVDMSDPNSPNIGADIFLDRVHRAQLHACTMDETWDWGLASYNNPTDALQAFRTCADGTTYPNANSLASDISIGKRYYKVGARTLCTTGKLLGVGDRKVGPYADGRHRHFKGQLIYEKMGIWGDSGSIIVREEDNAVTGLFMSSTNVTTTANPLYKIGWHFLGTISLEGGGTVPVYDLSKSKVPTSPKDIPTATDLNATAMPSVLDLDALPMELPSSRALRQLPQSKVFLGEAILREDTRGYKRWIKPVPPAMRGSVVEKYLIRIETTSQMYPGVASKDYHYLCFGDAPDWATRRECGLRPRP